MVLTFRHGNEFLTKRSFQLARGVEFDCRMLLAEMKYLDFGLLSGDDSRDFAQKSAHDLSLPTKTVSIAIKTWSTGWPYKSISAVTKPWNSKRWCSICVSVSINNTESYNTHCRALELAIQAQHSQLLLTKLWISTAQIQSSCTHGKSSITRKHPAPM